MCASRLKVTRTDCIGNEFRVRTGGEEEGGNNGGQRRREAGDVDGGD